MRIFECKKNGIKRVCLFNNFISATKVSLSGSDNSSDILGISGIVIHDLKQRRLKDYEFNWNSMFDVSIFFNKNSIIITTTECIREYVLILDER